MCIRDSARAIPFNDFMPDGIDKGIEVLNLHGGNPIHINLNIRKKLDKVLMGGKFAEQTVVNPTAFQKCNHLIIQMQLRQWCVDLLPVFCPAQQIINGNPIEVCQRDKAVSYTHLANDACDAGRITVNGVIAKASYQVKVDDIIEINLGSKTLKAKVTGISEHATKETAADYYVIIE